MCDRAVPQQGLCADLAGLVHVLPPAAVVPWLRGFWATMAREWSSIDVLRLDKFLLLVRRVLGESLLWMKVREGEDGGDEKKKGKKKAGRKEGGGGRWNAERVEGIIGLLAEWPFVLEDDSRPAQEDEPEEEEEEDEEMGTGTDGKKKKDSLSPQYVPVGLKLHVLDIWVDEAERVGLFPDDDDDDEARDIVRRITELVETLQRCTMSTAVRIRSRQSLVDDRLPSSGQAGQEDEDSD